MQKIESANAEAVARILGGDPVLVDVIPAGEAIPELKSGRKILHAGPPIGWDRMCGPMRGAVMGIAVFEGWASGLDDAAARALAREGKAIVHLDGGLHSTEVAGAQHSQTEPSGDS